MKKIFILKNFFLIFFMWCFINLTITLAFAVSSSNVPNIQKLEDLYKKAYKMETLRLYPACIDIYDQISQELFSYYSSLKDKNQYISYIPLVISSVFRYGVASGKNNYQNMLMLSDQISQYHKANSKIETALKIIVELNHINNETLIPKTQYTSLFFIRGYTKLGLAYKLLEGIAWKNYIVYPVQDIIGLIQFAIQDIKSYMEYQNVPYDRFLPSSKTKRLSDYNGNRLQYYFDTIRSRFTTMDPESLEFKTYQLTNFSNNPDTLGKILAKRCYYQSFAILDFFYNKKTRKIFRLAQNQLTLSSILNKNNKSLFFTVEKMIEYLGLRS